MRKLQVWKWFAMGFLAMSLVLGGCDDDDNGNGNDVGDTGRDVGDAGDTGDTGGDTGDTGDTGGDTGDTGNGADTGDASAASFVVVDCTTATVAETVSMQDLRFNPAQVSISVGDVVRWDNDETVAMPHTVTSGDPSDLEGGDLFDSGSLATGESYCVQFNQAGAFEYFCELHPTTMDDGLVTVQ